MATGPVPPWRQRTAGPPWRPATHLPATSAWPRRTQLPLMPMMAWCAAEVLPGLVAAERAPGSARARTAGLSFRPGGALTMEH